MVTLYLKCLKLQTENKTFEEEIFLFEYYNDEIIITSKTLVRNG